MNFALDKLGYKSKQDLFKNLYLKALIDSYRRIGRTSTLENPIRDQFVDDLEQINPLTKNLIREQILILNWERWLMDSEGKKSRADISFSISGLEFIIECKRLEYADSKYLDDGVKRFVALKYAKNNTHAGMIGFVISGDVDKITNNLKPKIGHFYFSSGSEKLLDKKCCAWKHSFQSRHNRTDGTAIHLYHLFFDFLPEKQLQK